MLKSIIAKNSMARKLLIPIMFVLFVQAIIFISTILLGGTLSHLKENSFNIMNEKLSGKKNYLQNEMILRWSNINSSYQLINNKIETIAQQNNISLQELNKHPNLALDMINQTTDDLINLLRKNSVTGAFVVLNSSNNTNKAGFYIRDFDPLSNSATSNDLLVEIGDPETVKELNLAFDSSWKAYLNLNDPTSTDFYTKPIIAAIQCPTLEANDLGYWSKPFKLDKNDVDIITYSQPLISKDGFVYGVLGISVTVDYLISSFPFEEVNKNNYGCYIISVTQDTDISSKTFNPVIITGNKLKTIINLKEELTFTKEILPYQIYFLEKNNNIHNNLYGFRKSFNLYSSNTPFENEKWSIIGLIEENKLLQSVTNVKVSIAIAFIASIIVGIIGILISGISFTLPIMELVEKVKNSNPTKKIKFDTININEIDQLTSSIENLTENVVDFSSKLSQIVDLSNTAIGAFEYNYTSNSVFCTKAIFKILDIENTSNYILKDIFDAKFNDLSIKLNANINQIYQISNSNNDVKWIKLKTLDNKDAILGVITDVTNDIIEKHKIEHERDHDPLTNLLNRFAFSKRLKEKFEEGNLKIGALIMFDLDNLKSTNDNYGHEAGDQYIKACSEVLNMFSEYDSIVSRMSGDEFYIFISGYDSKEALREIIYNVYSHFHKSTLKLSNTIEIPLKASAGISWYPDDSEEYQELIKFADFAMYEVKNSTKNNIHEYNKVNYNNSIHLLKCKEDFLQLTNNNLVQFAFQPIVDTRTANIYGFEALMRPTVKSLSSPSDVVELATMQSKLYDIEKLTFTNVIDAYLSQISVDSNTKLFINSIPNVILTIEEIEALEKKYSKVLKNMVVEILEYTKSNRKITRQKRNYVKNWGGLIVLDDFGNGYANNSALIQIKPDLVKIDMEITRDIDKDFDKQTLTQDIISYAHERNIKVISEGIETYEELKTLIKLDTDYVQGYYIAMPNLTIQDISPNIRKEILDIQRGFTDN